MLICIQAPHLLANNAARSLFIRRLSARGRSLLPSPGRRSVWAPCLSVASALGKDGEGQPDLSLQAAHVTIKHVLAGSCLPEPNTETVRVTGQAPRIDLFLTVINGEVKRRLQSPGTLGPLLHYAWRGSLAKRDLRTPRRARSSERNHSAKCRAP